MGCFPACERVDLANLSNILRAKVLHHSGDMSASSEHEIQGGSAGRWEDSCLLNSDLIIKVAQFCDTPTKAVVCRLNSQLRDSLQMVLFQRVEIRERHQLDAFARCVQEVSNDIQDGREHRMRILLAQVQCFIHRPSISPLWSQMYHPESTISKLSRIPQTTKSGMVIFHELVQARLTFTPNFYLEPLPNVETPPPGVLPSEGYETCFLANVKVLRLDEFAPQPILDLAPAFRMLGIRNLVSVTLVCSFGQAPYDEVPLYFRSQRGLQSVTILDQDHWNFDGRVYYQTTRDLERYSGDLEEFLLFWNMESVWPDLAELVLHTARDESRELMPSIEEALLHRASSAQWNFVTSRFCYKFGSSGPVQRPFWGKVHPSPPSDDDSSDDGSSDDSRDRAPSNDDHADLDASAVN